MDAQQREAYVRAALTLQGYDFDEACVARVVAQFDRIAIISQVLFDSDLPPFIEPAETFRP
jgi:Protein of unknown function (DUF4089)